MIFKARDLKNDLKILSYGIIIISLFFIPIFNSIPKTTDFKRHLKWTTQEPEGKYFTYLHKIINFIPLSNESLLIGLSIILRLSFRLFVLLSLMKWLGTEKGILITWAYLMTPFIINWFTLNQPLFFVLFNLFPDFQFYHQFTLPSFFTLNVLAWSTLRINIKKLIPLTLLLGRSSILLLLVYYLVKKQFLLFGLSIVFGLTFFKQDLFSILTKVISSSRGLGYPLFYLIAKKLNQDDVEEKLV